jgi:hypothetical protein
MLDPPRLRPAPPESGTRAPEVDERHLQLGGLDVGGAKPLDVVLALGPDNRLDPLFAQVHERAADPLAVQLRHLHRDRRSPEIG